MKKIISLIVSFIMIGLIMPTAVFATSKPSAPTISSYTAISSSSVKISWGSVSGATKYRVDRRRTDEDNYKTITSSCTSTSYTDTGLSSGSLYYYRVYAINSAGTSARSVTYATHTKPAAPVISSVNRDSNTQLTVSWGKVTGATKYKVMYRRGDQDTYSTATSSVTGTSFTHTGLTANAKYYYRVYAIREGAVGNEGSRTTKSIESERSETVGNFTKMSRPSNTIDNDNPSHVILSWKQAYGANEYAYDIYRKAPSDSGFTKIKNTKDLTYTDYGLTSGVIYKYKINTVTADGNSCTWSDEFYAAPKITTPISLTVNNLNSVQINWGHIPITSETNCQYTIKKVANGSVVDLATTSSTYYVDSNLSTGGTYTYWIQVRDPSGNYITSTYEKSITVNAPDLGTGFYASIMSKSGWKPIKAYSDYNVALGENAGTADTLWRFDRDSDGSYKISSVSNGWVLDAYGWGNDDGTNINTSYAHDDNKSNQRWYLFEQDGGYVLLPSYNTGLALDASGAVMSAGTNIQLWSRNNSIAQVYSIVKSSNTGIYAPTLNISTGSTDTETVFSWNSVPAAAYYRVTIYENGEIYKQEDVSNTEYSLQLGLGTYTAVVTAINNYESADGSSTSFQVGCNHSYGEWEEITAASCTEDGVRVKQCEKCGNSVTETLYALGHSYEETSIAATCTEDGKTEIICQRCGYCEKSEVLPATGHSFPDEWQTSKEATCTENGVEYRKCTVCEEEETKVIEATGHTYGDWTETTATCTENGYKRRECSVCGTIESEIEPAIGHQYEYWGETTPQGTEAVLEIWKCKYCNDTITRLPGELIKTGNISIAKYSVLQGKEITVSFILGDNPGIAAFKFHLDYDQNVLTPIKSSDGKYINSGSLLKDTSGNDIGSLLTNLDQGDGEVDDPQISWKNGDTELTDVTGNGELFNITFKIADTASAGTYPISITYDEGDILNKDGERVLPDTYDGSITVLSGDVVKGDIDLNGIINAWDSVLLAKYIVTLDTVKKEEMFTNVQKEAANVYADAESKIDHKDGIRLAQLIAGYSFDNDSSVSAMSLYSDSSEAIIEIGECSSVAGQIVEVPVSIKNNPGFAGFNFLIGYDSQYLTPISVADGELLDNIDIQCATNIAKDDETDEYSTDNPPEYVSVYCSNDQNIPNDGELFIVKFLINDNISMSTETPISISYADSLMCLVQGDSIDDIETTLNQGAVKITASNYPYSISEVSMQANDGTICDSLPKNGDVYLDVSITSEEEYTPAAMLITAFDENGTLIKIGVKEITSAMLDSGICKAYISNTSADIAQIKIFIWDSLEHMKPLARQYSIQ